MRIKQIKMISLVFLGEGSRKEGTEKEEVIERGKEFFFFFFEIYTPLSESRSKREQGFHQLALNSLYFNLFL